MTKEYFLELRHIRKEFGAFTALHDINLGIEKGEFVCFLGPSGCGKTTLLRVVAGLEIQTAGQVIQDGRDISRLPPAGRDYGIVFQSYALFPNLSVADNISYGLVNRKVAKAQVRQRVAELLKLVGLPGNEEKFPSQLSGGQQQRIALARALATSPGVRLRNSDDGVSGSRSNCWTNSSPCPPCIAAATEVPPVAPAASSASEDIPVNWASQPIAKPCAAAMPTRSPVKLPGPTPTMMRLAMRPSRSSAIIGTRRSAWPRPMCSSRRAMQSPDASNNATVQAAVDVSIARIIGMSLLTMRLGHSRGAGARK